MGQAQLQNLLDRQIGKGDIHNAVIGVQSVDRRIDIAAAAGLADTVTQTPMRSETPYLLASVSKMYTAALVLQLSQQGQLDLNEVISRYLPDSLLEGIHVYRGTDYSRSIRVHQLVSQTSGLADYYEEKPPGGQSTVERLAQGDDHALSIEQVMAIVRELKPKFEPGAKNGGRAFYTGTNYRLLGAIIEVVTGKTLVENLHERIFAPLGLEHTYAYSADLAASQPPADTYTGSRQLVVPKFLSQNTPDGGLVSTAAESIVFLRAFFEGRLFDRARLNGLDERWNAVFFPMQYGLGTMRLKIPRIMSPFQQTPEFIGHSGSTGAFAYFCPEKSLYIAGTLNQRTANRRAIQLVIQAANAAA